MRSAIPSRLAPDGLDVHISIDRSLGEMLAARKWAAACQRREWRCPTHVTILMASWSGSAEFEVAWMRQPRSAYRRPPHSGFPSRVLMTILSHERGRRSRESSQGSESNAERSLREQGVAETRMVNLPRLGIPLPALLLPSSVKGRIIAGFGLLIVILIAVVSGSAWLAREHRSQLAEMGATAATANLLENALFNVTLANLLLERYLVSENEEVIPMIRSSLATTENSLAEALSQEEGRGEQGVPGVDDHVEIERLGKLAPAAAVMSETFEQVIALRRSGDQEGARQVLEDAAAEIIAFELVVAEAADEERGEIPALQSQADRAANLVFWLLVLSGASGITMGLAASTLIARSILKPLSSVESVALAIAVGDLEARAQPSGPRELASLGASLNQMTESLLGLNRSLEEKVGELEIEITERQRAEEAMREKTRRDPLTNALNHGAILEEIQGLLADGGPDVSHAVAMIDVDGLKAVNDASGHQVGDAVLRAVTGALSKDGAIVGRFGGDEFVALLPGADRAGAERYRNGVLKKLQGARVTDPATGAPVPVAASIGLSVYPGEANTIGELIGLSDRAMYASRRQRPIRANGGSPTGPLGSDRAAEMVGQIVPLLTSPGQLEDKLRLVSQRICVGAGYDAVNIDLFDQAGKIPRARNTFAQVPDELVQTWRAQRRRIEEEPILQEIRSSGRAVIVDDPQNDERLTETQRTVLRAAELRSAVVTPLFWGEQFIGALSVGSKREAAFTVHDVEFLRAVADQVTAIARMANMVEELQSTSARLAMAQDQTVMLLAAAAEAHDETTGLHLRGVRTLVETLAQELGYDEDEARDLGLAAVLHDIGKIRVPESILARKAALPAEDWEIMKQHTIWGAEFLAGHPGLEFAGTIARSHHEQWDGSGYPEGLAGEAIPEQVSIVTVADAFDAMTHDRPYQASRSLEEAVREIARCSGQQFSPRVVEALQRVHRRNALPFSTAQAREDHAAA